MLQTLGDQCKHFEALAEDKAAQVAVLLQKSENQASAIETLRNDLTLAVKRRKKDMAAIDEKYRHEDYKSRYAVVVAKNAVLEEQWQEAVQLVEEVTSVGTLSDKLKDMMSTRVEALMVCVRAPVRFSLLTLVPPLPSNARQHWWRRLKSGVRSWPRRTSKWKWCVSAQMVGLGAFC